jgi:hypothetical protein
MRKRDYGEKGERQGLLGAGQRMSIRSNDRGGVEAGASSNVSEDGLDLTVR